MDKSTFNTFIEQRNLREEELFNRKFAQRKSNNQLEIDKLRIESFKQANDELLYKLFVEHKS